MQAAPVELMNCIQFLHHINNGLQNGVLWRDYRVVRSPGDSHCCLYSLVDSFNSQNPINIRLSVQHVINAICDETMKNSQMYKSCFDTNTVNYDILHLLQRNYVINTCN